MIEILLMSIFFLLIAILFTLREILKVLHSYDEEDEEETTPTPEEVHIPHIEIIEAKSEKTGTIP